MEEGISFTAIKQKCRTIADVIELNRQMKGGKGKDDRPNTKTS